MSAKLDKFNNEIIPLWDEVSEYVKDIDESKIADLYVENFAYLRKIITFLSEAMSCIDADYLPNGYIDNIKSYLSNIKNHLINSQNYTNSPMFQTWKVVWIICCKLFSRLFWIRENQLKDCDWG